jgi:hypothetical protein
MVAPYFALQSQHYLIEYKGKYFIPYMQII